MLPANAQNLESEKWGSENRENKWLAQISGWYQRASLPAFLCVFLYFAILRPFQALRALYSFQVWNNSFVDIWEKREKGRDIFKK